VTSLDAHTRDFQVDAANGLEVHVRVQGNGEPLLLLNGFTRPLETWAPFVEALDERTVISFDAPGVGASPVPCLPLSIAQLADVAASVLDEAGFDRVDVLGFSHGGAVAQQMALSHPQRVRRLVLVSTSCGLGTTLGAIDAFDKAALGQGATKWSNAVGALWHSMAITSWSSIPFLGAITSPTLVVCGTDDSVAPPSNSRSLAQRIPDASLVMIEGGHDLQLAAPAKRLATTVERFLGREAAGQRSGAAPAGTISINEVAAKKEKK
jgi:pimeloyl-ACP methyl ester carboxylesterase